MDGHAYTILNAAKVKDNENKMCNIVQMRNPWAGQEWDRDWSDKSEKWTEKTRIKLGVKDEDDGIFWMSFEDMQ